MEAPTLKDLILNVDHPLVLRGLEIPWKCEDSIGGFLQKVHSRNEDPEFEIAPQRHGETPQFERFRTVDPSINFGNFLEYSLSEKQNSNWTSFSYKSLRDLHFTGLSDSPMDMSFCGFPEISDEITVWLGSPGAHTSCHYDTYGRNVVVQMYGRKRWILFPPDTPAMHPTRIPYEESSVYSERNFFSPKRPTQNNDLKEFAHIIELNPGEVLIVPPKWWHYVETLENSLSFNGWISIDEDRLSAIDELLVLYQMINFIPQDMPEDKKALLINPNSIADFSEPPTGLLEILIQRVVDDDSPGHHKRPKREYSTNYLSAEKVQEITANHSKYASKVQRNADEFSKVMLHNSSRYCEKAEESHQETLTHANLTHLTSLINCFCAPSTIEAARKCLLLNHLK